MIGYSEALHLLVETAEDVGLLPFSSAPLREAAGRVAASPIASAEPLPAFDNSAMDGFAVVCAQTAAASKSSPARLPIVGSVAAGDVPPSPARAFGAFEIMTGAPIPAGFDAVARLEDVRREDGEVLVFSPVDRGAYVRRAGSDYQAGLPVVAPGERLDSRHLLALAALGVARVPVRWKPKVAVISTGRELIETGAPLLPGQIRNATGPYLAAALSELGAEPRVYGTVADDPVDFKRRMDAALSQENDLILTTGAVSMGRHDFVAAAVAELGGRPLFHKVAMRPGKPILAARFGHGPLLLGLPGNPVSTVVGLRFFVAPYLRRLLGQPPERFLRAALAQPVQKPAGLRCFLKARAAAGPAGTSVQVLPGQGSFQVRPLLEANAWAILPEEPEELAAGAEVDVAPILPEDSSWAPLAGART